MTETILHYEEVLILKMVIFINKHISVLQNQYMRAQEIININYEYLIYQIFRVGLYKHIHHPKAVVLKCSLYPDHLEDLLKQILGPT